MSNLSTHKKSPIPKLFPGCFYNIDDQRTDGYNTIFSGKYVGTYSTKFGETDKFDDVKFEVNPFGGTAVPSGFRVNTHKYTVNSDRGPCDQKLVPGCFYNIDDQRTDGHNTIFSGKYVGTAESKKYGKTDKFDDVKFEVNPFGGTVVPSGFRVNTHKYTVNADRGPCDAERLRKLQKLLNEELIENMEERKWLPIEEDDTKLYMDGVEYRKARDDFYKKYKTEKSYGGKRTRSRSRSRSRPRPRSRPRTRRHKI